MDVSGMKAEAEAIEAYLAKHHDGTVQEIAAELDIPVDQVIAVMDQWQVDDKGKVKHAGEGRGGNFAPARAAQEKLAKLAQQ